MSLVSVLAQILMGVLVSHHVIVRVMGLHVKSVDGSCELTRSACMSLVEIVKACRVIDSCLHTCLSCTSQSHWLVHFSINLTSLLRIVSSWLHMIRLLDEKLVGRLRLLTVLLLFKKDGPEIGFFGRLLDCDVAGVGCQKTERLLAFFDFFVLKGKCQRSNNLKFGSNGGKHSHRTYIVQVSFHVDQRQSLFQKHNQHSARNPVLVEAVLVHVCLLSEHERRVFET